MGKVEGTVLNINPKADGANSLLCLGPEGLPEGNEKCTDGGSQQPGLTGQGLQGLFPAAVDGSALLGGLEKPELLR